MEPTIVPSDIALVDLLRRSESMTVPELSGLMEVTATAVRQRLTRLMAQGYIERRADRSGRGRPSHRYRLTERGRRKAGENFADLAVALWQEIRSIRDLEVRRGLLARISKRLAELYGLSVGSGTLAQRLQSLVALFEDRQIPFEVSEGGELPVLKAHACPYPELAEQDRAVCAMERMMFEELLGQPVRLNGCRLDGQDCCTFEMGTKGPAARRDVEANVRGINGGVPGG